MSYIVKIHPSDKRRAFQDLKCIGGEILDGDDMFAPPPLGYNRISEGSATYLKFREWLHEPYITQWWAKLDEIEEEEAEAEE